jgi:hypothetical protein
LSSLQNLFRVSKRKLLPIGQVCSAFPLPIRF